MQRVSRHSVLARLANVAAGAAGLLPAIATCQLTSRRCASSSKGSDGDEPLRFGGSSDSTSAGSSVSQAPIPVPRSSVRKFDERGHRRDPDEPLDWTEPTLADIDRSIPQIDCRFLAQIVNMRTAERDEFERVEDEKRMKRRAEREAAAAAAAAKGNGKAAKAPIEEDPEEVRNFLKPLPDEREVLDEQMEGARYRPEYDDGFVIIDCRTVDEVTSWGMVEGAKLLPAHDMFEALHMTPEDFHENFGFDKPRPEDKLIFYCMYGPRSLMAAQIASWMGFQNVLHLQDGYYEWAKQYNLLVRRWREHDKECGNNDRRLATFQLAKELARDVAPEFNNLIEAEASRYRIDHTRSRGKLIVGETVLEKAQRQIEERRVKLIERGLLRIEGSSSTSAATATTAGAAALPAGSSDNSSEISSESSSAAVTPGASSGGPSSSKHRPS